jgi:hypothetical protein
MDPAAQPVSTVTKITAVCAVVTVMATKLVNSGFSVLEAVEDGSTKFVWKMDKICVSSVTFACNYSMPLI